MAHCASSLLNEDLKTPLNKENAVEFIREIEVESCKISLQLSQYSIGDEGCVVWDAGIVLGKYFDHLQSSNSDWTFSEKTVIDIGSGTGVVGLIAAALGANVMLTDLPDVIPLLEKNIKANRSRLSGSASASVLSWGENFAKISSPDVILVSDCIYYDMSVIKLIPTLIGLSFPETDLFISYEDRDLGNKKELLRKFLDELRKSFEMNIIPRRDQHPDYNSPDIHILKCKKKQL